MILQGCPALVRSGRSPIRFTSAYVTEAWIPGDTLRYRYVVDAVGGGSDSLVLASAAEAVAQKRSDASSRRWAISVRDFSVVTPDAWFLQRREHVLTGTRGTDEVSMVRIFLYSSGERRWIAQTAVAQL
jgi:hypothetical protein